MWIGIASVCLGNISAASEDNGAYRLKAAFMYRFAIFVEWPEQVFTRQPELSLCVLGDDPFGLALDAIQGKQVQQRRLHIQFVRRLEALDLCHILFISASEQAWLEDILAQAHARHILTISDMAEFTPRGGMIQFVMRKDKLRFKVNRDSAEEAGLVLSSNLLRLALEIYAAESP